MGRLQGVVRRAKHEIKRQTFPVPPELRTACTVDGRPVALIHNPRCGGQSLRSLLGAGGVAPSHHFPARVFNAWQWQHWYTIVTVRHPLRRFLSGYRLHVLSDYRGALYRKVGARLKTLTPLAYLDLVLTQDRSLAPQVRYVTYPLAAKPVPDLILRFEQIDTWLQTLQDAGVTGLGTDMPHVGATRAPETGAAAPLDLRPADRKTLFRRVAEAYRQDHALLGYDPAAANAWETG